MTQTRTLADLAVEPRPDRSLARRLAERWHEIETARASGWRWADILAALQAEGIQVQSESVLRKAVTRARRLVEAGKVQPRPLPRVPAGGSSRPAASPLSRPGPNRTPAGEASPFGDDSESLIQRF